MPAVARIGVACRIPCSVRKGKFHSRPGDVHTDDVDVSVLVADGAVARLVDGGHGYPHIACRQLRQGEVRIALPVHRNTAGLYDRRAAFNLIGYCGKPRHIDVVFAVRHRHGHPRVCGILAEGDGGGGLVDLNERKALGLVCLSFQLRVARHVVHLVVEVILSLVADGDGTSGKCGQSRGRLFGGVGNELIPFLADAAPAVACGHGIGLIGL